jgi:hypothetical protein
MQITDGNLVFANTNAIGGSNLVINPRSPGNFSGWPTVSLPSNLVTPANLTLTIHADGLGTFAAQYNNPPFGKCELDLNGNSTWSGPVVIDGQQTHPVSGVMDIVNIQGQNVTFAQGINGTNFYADASDSGMNPRGLHLFGNAYTFQGPLALGGSLVLEGSPSLVLNAGNGANSCNLLRVKNNAVIQLGADEALPTNQIELGQKYALYWGGGGTCAFDLNGHSESIGSLTNVHDVVTFWIGNGSSTAPATLNYNGTYKTIQISNGVPVLVNNNNVLSIWNGFIVDALYSTSTPQKTSLNVNGGYLILTPTVGGGAYPTTPYTGTTTVSSGTLEVDRALGTSAVTVNSAGTLRGNGTLSGSLTMNGTIAPGSSSLGALTVNNNVVFGAGTNNGVFRVNLDNSTYDQLVVNGNLNYGGTLNLTITNVGISMFTPATVLPLFPATSYTAGGTVRISPAVPAPGMAWDTSKLSVDGTLRVKSVVNTASPAVSSTISAGNLTISWPADHVGWRLQVQTNQSGGLKANAWVDVPNSGSASSFTIPMARTNSAVFYRLVYP